jgi:cellulose biosynthesis protein BcsQ
MRWKKEMLDRLERISRENEWTYLRAKGIIHLMPPDFLPAVLQAGKHINQLRQSVGGGMNVTYVRERVTCRVCKSLKHKVGWAS